MELDRTFEPKRKRILTTAQIRISYTFRSFKVGIGNSDICRKRKKLKGKGKQAGVI